MNLYIICCAFASILTTDNDGLDYTYIAYIHIQLIFARHRSSCIVGAGRRRCQSKSKKKTKHLTTRHRNRPMFVIPTTTTTVIITIMLSLQQHILCHEVIRYSTRRVQRCVRAEPLLCARRRCGWLVKGSVNTGR